MVSETVLPDFREVAVALAEGQELHLQMKPIEAFTLVSHLQFSTRAGESAGIDVEMMRAIAVGIQGVLSEHYPQIGELLEMGWHHTADVDPKLDYSAQLDDFSVLLNAFPGGVVPVQHPFLMSNQSIGPHYVLDAGRITSEQREALVAIVVDRWCDAVTDSTIDQARGDIEKGLPLKREHFTGQILSQPKRGND